MAHVTCRDCRFYLKFTSAEAEAMRGKLSAYGVDGQFTGACAHRSAKRPDVIRIYLENTITNCPWWERGFYTDTLGKPCPSCTRGKLGVKRIPRKNGNVGLVISCTQYPSCRYETLQVDLTTECRFCHIPLKLTIGADLLCSCIQCNRKVTINLTLRSWPQLTKHEKTCPHGREWPWCWICKRAIGVKQSLIDFELESVAAYSEQIRTGALEHPHLDHPPASRSRFNDLDSWDIDYDQYGHPDAEPDPDHVEAMNEIYGELSEWNLDWARSDDEGWFYSS